MSEVKKQQVADAVVIGLVAASFATFFVPRFEPESFVDATFNDGLIVGAFATCWMTLAVIVSYYGRETNE